MQKGPAAKPSQKRMQKPAKKGSNSRVLQGHFKKPQRTPTPLTRHQESLQRFADIIMRVIRAKLSSSAFTRDDLLALVSQMRLGSSEDWATGAAGVNDTATGTRYRKVCDAVQYLIGDRQLVSLDWVRVCLPEVHQKLATEEPSHIAYLPTIRRLVQQYHQSNTILDAMAVVEQWRSDQHLPENVKRMAVRAVFPTLVREGVLKRGSFKTEFIVK